MSNLKNLIFDFLLVFLFLVSSISFAVPNSFNFQARIKKPDGKVLESAVVDFRFIYTNEAGTCVLYSEDFAGVTLAASRGGYVNIQLGAGTRIFPTSGATSMYDIFKNSNVVLDCQGGGTFTPIATDRRSIVMQFNYTGSAGWQTLPAMKLNSVPFSMYSNESLISNNALSLGGIAASSYPKLTDFSTCVASEVLTFNGTSFSCVTPSGSGTVTSVTASLPLSSSGGATPNISIATASASTSGALNSSDWSLFNSKQSALGYTPLNSASNLSDLSSAVTARSNLGLGTASVLNAPASGDASVTELVKGDDSRLSGAFQASTNLSGDVTGTVNTTLVSTIGGKSAAQVATSVSDTQAAASANNVSTLVKRDGSGNFTAGTINATTFSGTNLSATNTSTQNIYLYDSLNINRIIFKAPTAGITNYTLTLPPAVGSNGQVLSTDAGGQLSWINPSTGSVTNVGATAPIISSGGATPAISMSAASGTVDGYLASSDWTTFSNKLGTALTSGNIFVGNGSNVATGVSVSGDASLSNTGVITLINTIGSSGTSSKVTYDAKGRITATSSLDSSDITGALSFTPINKSGDTMAGALNLGGQTLYGSSSSGGNFTLDSTSHATKGNILLASTSGNVGIGTASPAAKLDVQGAAISRANIISTGAIVDLSLSNVHLLKSVGGSAVTLQNPLSGGSYTLIISDLTARTYTFSGCTNSYFNPANGVSSGRSTYSILVVVDGANTECYIAWMTGFN